MLPFHVTKMLGLNNTHGFALVSEIGIKLVFRSAEDIKSKPDQDADSHLIPWSNLKRLDVSRGYLADEIVIEVHKMDGEDPDGVHDNTIHLQLQKRDRPQLDRFEQHVTDYQSGKRKDDVDDVLDEVRNLLDRM